MARAILLLILLAFATDCEARPGRPVPPQPVTRHAVLAIGSPSVPTQTAQAASSASPVHTRDLPDATPADVLGILLGRRAGTIDHAVAAALEDLCSAERQDRSEGTEGSGGDYEIEFIALRAPVLWGVQSASDRAPSAGSASGE